MINHHKLKKGEILYYLDEQNRVFRKVLVEEIDDNSVSLLQANRNIINIERAKVDLLLFTREEALEYVKNINNTHQNQTSEDRKTETRKDDHDEMATKQSNNSGETNSWGKTGRLVGDNLSTLQEIDSLEQLFSLLQISRGNYLFTSDTISTQERFSRAKIIGFEGKNIICDRETRYQVIYDDGTKKEDKIKVDRIVYPCSDVGIKLFFAPKDIEVDYKTLMTKEPYATFDTGIKKLLKEEIPENSLTLEVKGLTPEIPSSEDEINIIIASYDSVSVQKKDELEFAKKNRNGDCFARIDLDMEISDSRNVFSNHYYLKLYLSKKPIGERKELPIDTPIWQLYAGLTTEDDYRWTNYTPGFTRVQNWFIRYLDSGPVIDWRSPIASLYYETQRDKMTFNYTEKWFEAHKNDKDFEEIAKRVYLRKDLIYKHTALLKREFHNSCTDFKDKYVINREVMHGDIDDFLFDVLYARRESKDIRDIILTIQANQYNIIKADVNSNHITQGCAGSGKTMVLLHRISYLLFNYHLDRENIFIITPNELFNSFIAPLIQELDLKNISCCSREQFVWNIIEEFGIQREEILENVSDTYDSEALCSDSIDSLLEKAYDEEHKRIIDTLHDNTFTDFAITYKYAPKENVTLRESIQSSRRQMILVKEDLSKINDAITEFKDLRREMVDAYSALTEMVNEKVAGRLELPNGDMSFVDITIAEEEIKEIVNNNNYKDYIKGIVIKNDEWKNLNKQLLKISGNFGRVFRRGEISKYREELIDSISKVLFLEGESVPRSIIEKNGFQLIIEINELKEEIHNSDEDDIQTLCAKVTNLTDCVEHFVEILRNIWDYSVNYCSETINNSILNCSELFGHDMNESNFFSKCSWLNEAKELAKFVINLYELNGEKERQLLKKAESLLTRRTQFQFRNKDINPEMADRMINDYDLLGIYTSDVDGWLKRNEEIKPIEIYCNCCKNAGICSNGVPSDLALHLMFATLYGRISTDSNNLLFVDEGQELSVHEYKAIHNAFGGNINFNIYGDVRQRSRDDGITSWEQLTAIIDCELHELNENYRNTTEITEYCNKRFNLNMLPIGINGENVEELSLADYKRIIYDKKYRDRDTAIITNNREQISQITPDGQFAFGDLVDGKTAVLTLAESKGLEFNNVFAFIDEMDENEKYIACTRALSKLYVIR